MTSKLRSIALAVAPIWLSSFDRWQARRARERQRAQRILDRMANGDDTPSMPPEPRIHINDVWVRINPRRQPWQDYRPNDTTSWDAYVRQQRGTSARDNLMRRFR